MGWKNVQDRASALKSQPQRIHRPMDKNELIKRLTQCIDTYRTIDATWDAYAKTTGAAPESPLFLAIWKPFDAYMDTLAELVGDRDKWIGWFIYEHDCGAKAYEARSARWKKARKIRTVKNLAALIIDSWPEEKGEKE